MALPARPPLLRCTRLQAFAARCLVALAAGLPAAALHASLATAVEYYHAGFRHYFITARADEIALLDDGTLFKGWQRTGGEFSIHTDAGPGRVPVCRFFGTPGVGPNSHFYTADVDECEKVKASPGWTYEGVAYYIALPAGGNCPAATYPVWRSLWTDATNDINHRFTADLTAFTRMARRGWILEGLVMCAPQSDADLEADIVRLLEQSTLGPTEALVQQVKAKGIGAWLDEQLALDVTHYTQLPVFHRPLNMSCKDDLSLPWTPEKFCGTNRIGPAPVAWEFFRQARTAPDQLRLRMAHVWHQIFVVRTYPTYATADFQQRLRTHAFGSFENLLVRFTLAPQLGEFQNWVRNVFEENGVKPNENFARELLQLFTVGVNQLAPDGTPLLDASGQQIPTYRQSDIAALSRVLTGFTYPTEPGTAPDFWRNGDYYLGDMLPFDEWHDRGTKSLFNGTVQLYSGSSAMGELRTALRVLVDHSNTPQFIARQLIQKTVTSSPTPGYVARVAAVFRNNGRGVRGDLAAVTKAILIDPEARGPRKIDPEYGRLREPALMWTAMIRALDVTTDGVNPAGAAAASGQILFQPETVFNYYPADFTLLGGNVPAPEFGLYTSAEFLDRANQINDLLYNADQSWSHGMFGWGPQAYVPNATGTPSPTLAAFLPDAGNPEALVARLDRLFLHGAMRPAMRRSIVNAVSRVAPSSPLRRVKLAVNLTLASIDWQVQK